MTKQQTIELLNQQLPSFYSVEQVIKIINDIETPSSSITVERLEELKTLIEDKVSTSIRNMDERDIVDYDSLELSLDRDNRIEVDSFSVYYEGIVEEVLGAVDGVLIDFFEDKEERG